MNAINRPYNFKHGDWVQSHFRAPWKGVIVGRSPLISHCYIVMAIIDRHNNMLRKPFVKSLDGAWLTLIQNPLGDNYTINNLHLRQEMRRYWSAMRWGLVDSYSKSIRR